MIKWYKDLHRCNIDQFTMMYLNKTSNITMRPKGVSKEIVIKAEVNHGRWIVKCPWCSGAEMADKEDPRFFCLDCFNAAIRNYYATVEFPDDKTIAQIEKLLEARPVKNQNWVPTESVTKLRSDNKKFLGGDNK